MSLNLTHDAEVILGRKYFLLNNVKYLVVSKIIRIFAYRKRERIKYITMSKTNRKSYIPQNKPSSLFDKYGIHDVDEQDQRYCAGHKSNRFARQRWSKMLRSKIKTETNKLINEQYGTRH